MNSIEQRDRVDAAAAGVMVVLCAMWGLQQVSVKVALAGGLPPLLQAGLRSVVAAVCVVAWICLQHGPAAVRRLLRVDASVWPGMAIGLVFGAEFLALYPGVKLTTASRAVLFLYTAPFFTALGAHLFLPGERLRLRQAVGLLVAFGGVAAAFAQGLVSGGGSMAGDALCALSAVLWAVLTLTIKASPALGQAGSAKVLLYQLGGSAVVLLVAASVSGETGRWPEATWLAWAAFAYQAVPVAFGSYLAYFWLVLIYPAGRLSGFTFLTPVFGVTFGALLLGESLGPALFAGIVAIAIGLHLLNAPAPSRAVPAGRLSA
jgi:drug/metabolite transporter (DMT)-like permease